MPSPHRRLKSVTVRVALAAVVALVPTTLAAPIAAAAEHTIAEIQGTGSESPFVGEQVSTPPSVVTAVYESGPTGFSGFVIQEPGSGGQWDRQAASQAIFVYMGRETYDVEIGDAVTVTGEVDEFNGLTEIVDPTVTPVDEDLAAPEPISGVSWQQTRNDREGLESMLFEPDQTFTVADTYPLYNYGELALGADGVPVQPTEAGAPGSDAYRDQLAANEANRVNLDDGSNRRFTADEVDGGDTLPYLTEDRTVRRGDTVEITEPVIVDFRNGSWKFNPTEPFTAGEEPVRIDSEPRPEGPEVGGALTVASFNVLNYFTSTGEDGDGCTGGDLDVTGSPNSTWDCDLRGAWDDDDLQRQQAKIVNAINTLDPAVAGLMEIENSIKLGEQADEATASLVQALNEDAGEDKWDYVRSGDQLPDVADQDFIGNALIYQPAEAELTSDLYADGDDAAVGGAFANARTPIAATFAPADGGAEVLVSVNHFKSKGSPPDSDDDPNADRGDGQGAWNAARVAQAEALADWIADVQQDSGVTDTALIGDFNAYSQEDPIRALADAGYRDVAPDGAYSYTFDGLAGSLDHVLLNESAAQRLTDAAIWEINSPEPMTEEYSTYRTTKIDYYDDGPQRSSDHDPVIVGLEAGRQPDPTADPASLTLLNINDFHGRIAPEFPDTTGILGTVVEERAKAGEDNAVFLSAGDNIGASLFASSIQQDQPTIDVLNAAGLESSAVGNHEFDKGLDDLTDRVMTDNAEFDYLGANVYEKGTETPALPEYDLITKNGIDIAVIGAVTQETRSLVSPDGITDIDFGDPVAAVNRVAARLTDGDPDNGEADVIIAEYHEGAVEGEPSGTLADEVSKGGAFAKIVKNTSAAVDAIFTGHTHQSYAWDAPIPGQDGTRPIVQTGSYGEFIGKVVLEYDPDTDTVTSYTAENIGQTETPVDELVDSYPAVAEIKEIVDAALAEADELGSVEIGKTSDPITRATVDNPDDPEDRAGESTVSNLVATMFRDQLSDPLRGGAQIGVQNPGGNREDLDAGPITYGEAAAVLPFANTLMTLDLTGAQFKIMLEQQWQTNEDGSPCTECSRPYLQLGLSDNVSYTYDESKPWGERITSITIDGKPYDPAASYRIGTASFLAAGGDNFWVFTEAKDKKDSGLIDLDSWVEWIKAESPISPSFARRASTVTPLPEELTAGTTTRLTVGDSDRAAGGPNNSLDLTSEGAPENTRLVATLDGSDDQAARSVRAAGDGVEVGTATVTDGVATIDVAIPESAQAGPATLHLTAEPSGTVITLPVRIGAAEPPGDEPTDEPTDETTDEPTDEPTGSPTGEPDDPGSTGDLGDTGSTVSPALIVGAALLVAIGVTLLVVARVRSRS